jgi:uncharacterized protein
MKRIIFALAIAIVLPACEKGRETESERVISSFSLQDVRLLDGPFKQAEQRNLRYIMAMDPDRLLAPYLREAGLEPRRESYGNWENTGLDGHIGGHYLTSLSLAYASTGDVEAHRRLNYMLDELQRVQAAHGDGYIGGVPGGRALWRDIAAGRIDADLFALNGKWVPWYNLHKVYAGLLDAYVHAGSEQARVMLMALADWTVALVDGLTDEQIQTMLRTEHGGMNEVFADLAELTGERKYLTLARQFSHRQILDPLLAQEDRLTGLHANTQIPKVVGFQRVAQVSGDADWQQAAKFFWNTVVERRTVAIGGNSVREHFHAADDFEPMIADPVGPETCNTYNMLKLSRMLYGSLGELRYVDYYERALYNHILSSQHPGHGGLVYFTSMRPGHYRMYSQPEKAMWCCVGSGIENHFKYGELIYAHGGDNLYVNLFIPSRLNWRERGIQLAQVTDFPDAETTRLIVESGSGDFTLNLRYPAWVRPGALGVSINGEAVAVGAGPVEYVALERQWQAGDEVTLTLPMYTKLEQLPDQSDYYAVLHGPIVLAAKTEPFRNEQLNFLSDDSRMGHIAQGEMCPPEAMPMLVGNPEEFIDRIRAVPGKPMTFVAPEALESPDGRTLELIPFFRLHDARYTLYWPHARAGLNERRLQAERERLALAARTIDQVAPGEQQPESDHFFRGENTEAGVHRGRHWRHASGWFSYQLRDPDGEAQLLRITYYGLDAGRSFDISFNGTHLATVHLKGERGDDFYTVDYPVPSDIVSAAEQGVLEVRFSAHENSIAGGIYGVRLLRAESINGGSEHD